ncbi:MAG: hypothetical protein R3272_16525 [Candidatus Promineifilaceae bacterium]|nr:hypothetical protein [Candidatus Promineifilaceae bacterium]
MSSESRPFVVTVDTALPSDTDRLAELTRNLRRELLESDVEDVRPVEGGAAPPGAKGLSAFDWNSLMVLVDPRVLASVFGVLTSWVRRNDGTSLTLKAGDCDIELKGMEIEHQALQEMLRTCLEAAGREALEEPAGGTESDQGTGNGSAN